jgi:diaminohydroxyphosphoribosylaminopyrimidine deaminase / 5-amino-6-(5-phosphoribosylamino)uracil reductase
MALANATQANMSTAGLTAVVTLEPCAHTGRTGPCVEALKAAGIARVVFSVSDPGGESAGGAQRLLDAGIDVYGGFHEPEGVALLERWLVATQRQRPWVTAKWAMSLDGRAAAADGSSQWITGVKTREKVHYDRSHHDAIVVGTHTVIVDDPRLTARTSDDDLYAHQPRAIVVGERDIPEKAQIRSHPGGFTHVAHRDLDSLLETLFGENVRRVYVEGGPTLTSAFIAKNLVDEFHITLGPLLLGGNKTATTDIGVASMELAKHLSVTEVRELDGDIFVVARPHTKES